MVWLCIVLRMAKGEIFSFINIFILNVKVQWQCLEAVLIIIREIIAMRSIIIVEWICSSDQNDTWLKKLGKLGKIQILAIAAKLALEY